MLVKSNIYHVGGGEGEHDRTGWYRESHGRTDFKQLMKDAVIFYVDEDPILNKGLTTGHLSSIFCQY
ncbi:hypothetical protein CHS0354_022282 [Potamilus streckersoni]|uniref:Uncharacterized protein n=1 Tax=Potamilus streckersoni TaxID=2493646 RepID=A0AAE0WCG2_9BIVA|nr:hypothetical protein CHS0354_022282 [Potamilus streckersoni]